MRKVWISTPKFTGQVDTESDCTIINTPPVWRKLRGQKLIDLIYWLRKLGSVKMEDL